MVGSAAGSLGAAADSLEAAADSLGAAAGSLGAAAGSPGVAGDIQVLAPSQTRAVHRTQLCCMVAEVDNCPQSFP